MFWQLDIFPTRAAADVAKTPSRTVVEVQIPPQRNQADRPLRRPQPSSDDAFLAEEPTLRTSRPEGGCALAGMKPGLGADEPRRLASGIDLTGVENAHLITPAIPAWLRLARE